MELNLIAKTKICICLGLTCLSFPIHSENVACKKIKDVYLHGRADSYSVPYKQGGIDNVDHDLVYDFYFDKDKSKAQISADCGNGADAECLLALNVKGTLISKFSLPTSIRLINFEGVVYIVNGVVEYPNKKVKFENFLVNAVSPDGIEQICP